MKASMIALKGETAESGEAGVSMHIQILPNMCVCCLKSFEILNPSVHPSSISKLFHVLRHCMSLFLCCHVRCATQWVLMVRVTKPKEGETKEEKRERESKLTLEGLDTNFTKAEAEKILNDTVAWMEGGCVGTWPYKGKIEFYMMGGNHKLTCLKMVAPLLPHVSAVHHQRVRVFWGITLTEQLKVCCVCVLCVLEMPLCLCFLR